MKTKKRTSKVFLALCSLCLFLSACFSNSDGFTSILASENARAQQLNRKLAEYQRAIYWNDQQRLASLITPRVKPTIDAQLRARKTQESLVETEISDIKFNPDLSRADVDVKVKFYKTAHNIVQERTEKQTWSFYRFAGGWKLVGLAAQTPKNSIKKRAGSLR